MKTLVLSCALAAVACARGNAPGAASQAVPGAVVQADTLRGTIEVVGSEPGTALALLDGHGGAVSLQGPRPLLDRLAGLEVMVEGSRMGPRDFRVARVTVRASGGVAAVDGVVAREGGRWVLVTADGRRLPAPHLPEQVARPGLRVWLAGPLDQPPVSFGVIGEGP